MNTPNLQVVQPSRCHLWTDQPLRPADLGPLIRTAVYYDDGHLIRALLECTLCGQHYYYEFREEIDWAGGNDPQYRTYIPIVNDPAAIEALNRLDSMELLTLRPRLQDDWGSDEAVKPGRLIWIGFKE